MYSKQFWITKIIKLIFMSEQTLVLPELDQNMGKENACCWYTTCMSGSWTVLIDIRAYNNCGEG